MNKTRDKGKTKAQLIEELQALRRQLAELQGREEKGREQAEESSFRESDMLRHLMENVPDWIFFKDAESRIVRTNRPHAQLLGFDDPQEVVGKTDFDFFPPEDAQRFHKEEQGMLQSGQPIVARLGQTPGKDGEMLWVSETKIPLKDETGQVIGLVGISRNVTDLKRAEEALKDAHAEVEKQVEERTAELKQEVVERKRAEAALARESELLQALLDNSPDYIFFKDRESRFIKTNKAHAQNLLGVSDPREIEGKTDFDLYPGQEENTQRFYDEEQKLMETGVPVVGREWTVPSQATGEAVWLSEHKIPILSEGGEAVGLVCIGRDITARRQAEETLERRALQLQTAAEVSRAASSILDPDGLIQQAVNLVQERFNLYYAGLFLVDQAGEWAVLQAGTGEAGQQMLAREHKLAVDGESMIGWCVANKRARTALDVGKDAVRFENPFLPDTRSELALPLVSRSEAVGALTIQSTKEAAFSDEDISALQTMADQLANAIANARLYEQAQQAYAEVEQQVRERTAELEREQEESARLQQEVIAAQQRSIQELSTPIIPIFEGVIVMPLIGSIDTLRARDVTRNLLAGIREHHAKVVILDITGVPIVDSGVAAYLNKTIQAARLKGARTIVTGVSDAVAETIVDLGIDWSGIETLGDLRTGLKAALR